MGLEDGTRASVGTGPLHGAGPCRLPGLVAVWAEARQTILSALRRREVYATTGPRIRRCRRGSSRLGLNAAAAGCPFGLAAPPSPG